MGRQKYLKQNVTKKSHMIKGRNNFFKKSNLFIPCDKKFPCFSSLNNNRKEEEENLFEKKFEWIFNACLSYAYSHEHPHSLLI